MKKIIMEFLLKTGGKALKSTIAQFFSLKNDSKFVDFLFNKYKNKDNYTVNILKFLRDITPCFNLNTNENIKG